MERIKMNNDSIIMKKILILLEQIENNMAVRGVRGGGAAHPYPINKGKRVYGRSDYDIDDVETNVIDDDTSPIKISRAFKKDAENV